MNANSTFMATQLPADRIAMLEAANIVSRFSSRSGVIKRKLDHLVARLENLLIERVLLSRQRATFRHATDHAALEKMILESRAAYSDGHMETLPSFFPNGTGSSIEKIEAFQKPQHNTQRQRPLILYIPGGGFIMPPSKRQKNMVQRLSDITGCETILGNHRLAPEHPFPAAPEDICAQFSRLVDEGKPNSEVFIAADTAGASIALGAVQLLRERGLKYPAGIILFSPWCDLSLSGWSYITGSMTSRSPFRMETAAFCARLYLGDEPSTVPLASAIFADLTGFPPILIHTSKDDLHFDDAIRLSENGQKHGCRVKLNYWDSPRHHLERLSSEDAKLSFEIVAKFIDSNSPGI